jgi:RHS repeat-associated protein
MLLRAEEGIMRAGIGFWTRLKEIATRPGRSAASRRRRTSAVQRAIVEALEQRSLFSASTSWLINADSSPTPFNEDITGNLTLNSPPVVTHAATWTDAFAATVNSFAAYDWSSSLITDTIGYNTEFLYGDSVGEDGSQKILGVDDDYGGYGSVLAGYFNVYTASISELDASSNIDSTACTDSDYDTTLYIAGNTTISLSSDFSGDSYLADSGVWEIDSSYQNTVSQSTGSLSGTSTISLTPGSTPVDYTLNAGFDLNGDGTLDVVVRTIHIRSMSLDSLTVSTNHSTSATALDSNPVFFAVNPSDSLSASAVYDAPPAYVLWTQDGGSTHNFAGSTSLTTPPAGGVSEIDAGIDANADGVLESGEITRTIFIYSPWPQSGGDVGNGEGLGGGSGSPTLPSGIRTNGTFDLDRTDLIGNFPQELGQVRSWTNNNDLVKDGINGNNWDIDGLPSLNFTQNSVRIIISGSDSLTFYDAGGQYVTDSPSNDTFQKISANTSSEEYDLTLEDGEVYRFHGNYGAIDAGLRGRLISISDPDGNVTLVKYDTSNSDQMTEIVTTGTVNGQTITDSFVYSYYGSTSTANGGQVIGLISDVEHRVKVGSGSYQDLGYVVYHYYTGGISETGNSGDLKSATLESSNQTPISEEYYTYYTAGNSTNGYTGGLQYFLDAAGYARAVAAGVNFSTASNLAPFAALYVQYYSSNHYTKEEVVAGEGSSASTGQGTYAFTYSSSTFDVGYNLWATKTAVTLPDSSTTTVYANAYGQTMLTDHASGASHWIDYYQYDNKGHEILHANPSAVTGYSDSYGDLVHFSSGNAQYLSDSTGLINIYSYLDATTATVSTQNSFSSVNATAGSATNYLSDIKVRQGETGSDDELESIQYYGRTDGNGATTFDTATDTVYPDSSTNGRTTSYSYIFNGTTSRISQLTTTLPVISSGEDGPGSADVSTVVYDAFGRAIWTQDPDGFLTYTQYDPVTGLVSRFIQDVNTADTGDFSDKPTGSSWTSSGQELITNSSYQITSFGSTVETSDPNGNISWIVNDDVDHAVFNLQGVTETVDGSGNGTLTTTGPITLVRDQLSNGSNGSYTEAMSFSGTLSISSYQVNWPGFVSTSGNHSLLNLVGGASSGYQFTIQSLVRSLDNDAGQTIESDSYFNISDATYAGTSAGSAYSGSVNTNFYETDEGYNNQGLQNYVKAPTGTITRTVYDSLERVTSIWVGTNDHDASDADPSDGGSSPNNMIETTSYQYDNGSTGDSDLTQTTQYVSDPNAGGHDVTTDRVTQFYYDWRDRLVATKGAVQNGSENASDNTHFITYRDLDNLGEVTANSTYDGDTVTISDTNGVPNKPSSSLLRAKTATLYDDQGRPYETITYSVDPSNGSYSTASSDTIVSNVWYDHRSDVIASHVSGSPTDKYTYDGAGRMTFSYVTDGGAVNNTSSPGTILSSWSAADTVSNDIVLNQTQYTYDADGNVIMATTRQRFDDASTTSKGSLGTPTSTGSAHARVSYLLSYYDAANRLIETVDAGTNGAVLNGAGSGVNLDDNSDSVANRPSTLPNRTSNSNTIINNYSYNDAGWLAVTVDPNGNESKTFYDNLGRATYSVQAWNGSFDPTGGARPASDSANETTGYTYDGDGHILTITAVTATTQNNQTTQYIYNMSAAGVSTSTIYSNDLLWKVEYPDPSTGSASSSTTNQNTFTYNLQGEMLTKTDQNGTVHTFGYDVLGRLISDAVTACNSSNIDTSVMRITESYNTQGLLDKVTSYSSASGGTVVNQIQNVYNGFGQLTKQYQEHSGAVNTSSSMAVSYGYSDAAHGSRLTSLTYPSGTELDYNYGTSDSLNDVISRLDHLVGPDDSGGTVTLESYLYLGLSTVVQRTQNQANMMLTYIKQGAESNGDAGDKYTGLDRFGRVVDQRWIENSSGGSLDRYQYTYDNDGNVLSKTNGFDSTLDENYTYDALNRLTQVTRNGTSNNYQTFSLDALGNITTLTNGTNSGTSLTYNAQNQLNTSGGASLAFDNNGNTTTDDQGHTLKYDAWNRLISVNNGSSNIVTYAYDGLGRRITETPNGSHPNELYFQGQGQVLEEDVNNSGLSLSADQFWSPVYVNALICRDYDYNNNGSFVASERVYAIQDADYNVTALLTRYTLLGDGGSENGTIDIQDLSLVTNHWHMSVSGGDINGDFNHDGYVDITDQTIVTNDSGNSSGNVVWHVTERLAYDPYGNFTVKTYDDTGTQSGTSDFLAWDYTFQGGRWDSATKMVDFQNRPYSVSMMRFTRQDPLGYVDGMDDYLIEGANPVMGLDPSGLDFVMPGKGTGSIDPGTGYGIYLPVGGSSQLPTVARSKPLQTRPPIGILTQGWFGEDNLDDERRRRFEELMLLGERRALQMQAELLDSAKVGNIDQGFFNYGQALVNFFPKLGNGLLSGLAQGLSGEDDTPVTIDIFPTTDFADKTAEERGDDPALTQWSQGLSTFAIGTLLTGGIPEGDVADAAESEGMLGVNPTGSTTNCVNCSIATDSTLAGYPASALPGNPTSISILENTFGGTFQPVSGEMQIGSILSQAGNGSRGIVFGESLSGDVGHVFNVFNNRGSIEFLDGQIGGSGLINFDNFQNFQFLLTHLGTP